MPGTGAEPPSKDMPVGQGSNGIRRSARGSLADIIELRLPPTSDYLSVLRATIGVIAGGMSFNYDEIIQLRVAVSEAFNLAIRRVVPEEQTGTAPNLIVRFTVESERLEILIPSPHGYLVPRAAEEEIESQALLESLMDDVQLGGGSADEPVISMAKYKTAGEENSGSGGR